MKKLASLKKIGSMQLTIAGSLIALYLVMTVFLVNNWNLSIPFSVYMWLVFACLALVFSEIFILAYSKTSGYILKSKCLRVELPNDTSNYSRTKRCWHYLLDAIIISILWLMVDSFLGYETQNLMSSFLVLPFSISIFFFTSYVSTEAAIILRNYQTY